MVLKLNNKQFLFFIICFLAVGCSKHQKEQKKMDAEDIKVSNELFGEESKIPLFDDFINQAQSFYQKKKFEKLKQYVDQYKKEFKKEDQKDQIYLLNAMSLIGLKKLNTAEKLLQNLQKSSNPDIQGKSFFYLGDIERFRKQYKKSIELYQKAYDLLKNPEIFRSLADTYVSLKDWKLAKQFYKKTIEMIPDSKQDLYYLALIYIRENNFDQASILLKKILKDDPRFARSYRYLAYISKERGDMVGYYYNISRELLLKNKYSDVINLLKEKKEIYQDIRLFKILVSSYVRDKKPDFAKQVLAEGKKINQSFRSDIDIQIYEGILVILPFDGKKKAIQYFKNLYQKYSNNFEVIVSYADLLDSKKQRAAFYEKALKIVPSDVPYRYKLASIYQELSQFPKAQMHYGILYFYQGNYAQALDALLRLEDYYPNFKLTDIYFYEGKIYSIMNNNKLALESYQKALTLSPKDTKIQELIKELGSV